MPFLLKKFWDCSQQKNLVLIRPLVSAFHKIDESLPDLYPNFSFRI